MKNNLIVLCLCVLTTTLVSAQSKSSIITADIKVYGNCGMCKERIEEVLDHKGIKTASWDASKKNLHVVYNSKKITEQKIHELVASVGHDTDKAKANDEVYAKLPFCCLYRDHDHSGIEDGDHKKDDHHKKDH